MFGDLDSYDVIFSLLPFNYHYITSEEWITIIGGMSFKHRKYMKDINYADRVIKHIEKKIKRVKLEVSIEN